MINFLRLHLRQHPNSKDFRLSFREYYPSSTVKSGKLEIDLLEH